MFYTTIADLPTFGEGNANKESLIKKLQEENGVEIIQEGANVKTKLPEPQDTIIVDGKAQTVQKKKKKGCGF